ncbi:MAG: ATP-binding cassette domain-containing protein [Oscillospiraceae bacterium]|nr:ATP-binding cassette domain-containing protein [Oscillospiraceae bacterium]
MQREKALQLEDLVFRFQEKGKRNILDHVSLEIEAGGITVLMGSSGCGKSTLAAVAAGLYPENGGFLESGDIRLFGRPLKELNQQQRAAYLTLMFQNPDLQFCMNTLRKEMQFCMENICVPPEQMDEKIACAAERLGVSELLDRRLHSLSGGEKQKAALACLYVMESRCVLLDECFANIDRSAAREILELLLRMKQEGRTVIAIDHQADLWLDAADEIILLGEGGRVAARGICRENLAAYRPVFQEQGLFYPQAPERLYPPRPAGDPVLSFRDVSIRRGQTVKKKWSRKPEPDEPFLLRQASADFPRGCMTAVLGPSGSGKTTTFLAALKQYPYTGTILLNGRDLSRLRPRELYQQMGIVFQNPSNQFITQNVEEEICASLRVWDRQMPEEACRQRADQLLESYQLGRYRKYSPYMLSQGQQRRLAVLSVLAGGQKLLLLDEPTYGQDDRSSRAVMQQLRQKIEDEGLTVIFITHDRALAAVWADRIYELCGQKLVERAPEELCL